MEQVPGMTAACPSHVLGTEAQNVPKWHLGNLESQPEPDSFSAFTIQNWAFWVRDPRSEPHKMLVVLRVASPFVPSIRIFLENLKNNGKQLVLEKNDG